MLSCVIVRYRSIETGIANKATGDFVVGHVVHRRGCQYDIRSNTSQRFRDALAGRIIEAEAQVAKLETLVVCAQQVRRRPSLAATGFCNGQRSQFCTAAVTRRHCDDGDVVTSLSEKCQRAGTLDLDIIRMRMDGQNSAEIVCHVSVILFRYGQSSEVHAMALYDAFNAVPETGALSLTQAMFPNEACCSTGAAI